MKKLLFILLVFVGCSGNEPELFCAEGVRQHNGIRIFNSENENAEQTIIDFELDDDFYISPNIPKEYYVLRIYKCSSGFCIDSYEFSEWVFMDDYYVLKNGCR